MNKQGNLMSEVREPVAGFTKQARCRTQCAKRRKPAGA